MTSYTHNKMPPCRSGETGKKIGFSKILLNIASLKQHNCGSFRKRAASAWPGRKLKLGGSLLGKKKMHFLMGTRAASLTERPGHGTWPISVPQNCTVHQPLTWAGNQAHLILIWVFHLPGNLNLCHIVIGIKWDPAYKVLLTQSQRSINSSCD